MNILKGTTLFFMGACLLAGCGTDDVSTQGSGTQRISKKSVSAAENGQVSIKVPQLTLVKQEGATYLRWWFQFREKQPIPLRSVLVDDVTGGASISMINDQAPQLKENAWIGFSGLIDASPASTSWLYDSSDSVRIFRFVFVDINGNSFSLDQDYSIPGKAKATLRSTNGL
jgi:hypothetical protein